MRRKRSQKRKESIISHIYKYPFALIIYNSKGEWYSIRPILEISYLIEKHNGEGAEINQDKLFETIDKLFKEIF